MAAESGAPGAIRGLETVRLDASRRGSRKRRRTVNSRCRFPNRTCGARCSYAAHAWPSSEQAASVSLLASRRAGFWWCRGNLTDQAQPVDGELLKRPECAILRLGTIPSMRDVVILFVHLIVTVVRPLGPGGLRSVVAETLILRHQLLVLNRGRKRAPNLRAADRILFGLFTLLESAFSKNTHEHQKYRD